jgi:hypothetical protein
MARRSSVGVRAKRAVMGPIQSEGSRCATIEYDSACTSLTKGLGCKSRLLPMRFSAES